MTGHTSEQTQDTVVVVQGEGKTDFSHTIHALLGNSYSGNGKKTLLFHNHSSRCYEVMSMCSLLFVFFFLCWNNFFHFSRQTLLVGLQTSSAKFRGPSVLEMFA